MQREDTLHRKGSALEELRRRFHARVISNSAFSENLSNTIALYIQSVRSESGDLNGKNARFSARPGAPVGNRNRLVHGGGTREMDHFRKEVREHIKNVHTLIAATKR